MPDTPAMLDKPQSAAQPAPEPVIHVIPEKFHGSVARVSAKPKTPTAQPPVGQTPPPAVKPPIPAKKKSGRGIIVLLITMIVLVGGGVTAILLLRKPSTPRPLDSSTPPVCGNAKCESPGETAQSCVVDCGPPPPVCGDVRCEFPAETPQNCPVDCGPPPAICGDAKCEQSESPASCPADCGTPEPTPASDRDSDGLSDVEEETIFGSDPTDPDTDRDSFVDFNEALNLFDPAIKTPARLEDSRTIARHANIEQKFTMLRPVAMTAREAGPPPESSAEAGESKSETYFTAAGGEVIQVLVAEKPSGQSVLDWYLAQSPGVTSGQVETFTTRQGHPAVLSPDKMTAYIGIDGRVFVVSYDLGSSREIRYKATFRMMVNSLKGG